MPSPKRPMLSARDLVKSLGGRWRGNTGTARCPAHDDHNPSLSVSEGKDGKLLVHCHAGCAQTEVIEALTAQGLWPKHANQPVQHVSSSSRGISRAAPASAPEPNFTHPDLGKPSRTWEYRDQAGKVLGYVVRFDRPDVSKTFRPLTPRRNSTGGALWRWKGFDEPLPLFGLDQLSLRPDDPVLITEGEKAAEAAADLIPGSVVISWPHGAKSINKVDWSPLAKRSVTIWPDADEEGIKAAQRIAAILPEIGVQAVRLIDPPPVAPTGWDAADALEEDLPHEDLHRLLSQARSIDVQSKSPLAASVRLSEWQATRYAGQAPERQWLIQDVLPLGTPAMLAAFGGTGKSMLVLRIALEVACDLAAPRGEESDARLLGGKVEGRGAAVIITAEDDAEEIHRRLQLLDPEERRLIEPERLTIVPLPNTGGVMTLLRGAFQSAEITKEFGNLRGQLLEIDQLKLVVFDPLQAFVSADANKDPAVGQYFCTLLGQLAAETGACVLVTHHFRKQGRIKTPADARDAVRGTTALIDGMRCVYALWPVEEGYGRKACKKIGVVFDPYRVVRGAVVKANWPVNTDIHTHVRNEFGLLCDRTSQMGDSSDAQVALLDELGSAIAQAATEGKPYTKTGKNGVYRRREELPITLRRIGRNTLENMVQHLLDKDRVRQCSAGKSGSVQWLDVPGGKFAQGDGSFCPGALTRKPSGTE